MNLRPAAAFILTLLTLLSALSDPAIARSKRRPPAEESTVRAVMNGSRVRVGEVFLVTVRVQDARRIGSVPFTLTYDPAMLEYIPSRSREGSFLASGGAATSFLAKAGRAPGGGIGVIVGASRLGANKGASGSGVLCLLAFRAKAPGVANLSFERANVLSPLSFSIPSRFLDASVRVEASR